MQKELGNAEWFGGTGGKGKIHPMVKENYVGAKRTVWGKAPSVSEKGSDRGVTKIVWKITSLASPKKLRVAWGMKENI